jgi:hypothetical protein
MLKPLAAITDTHQFSLCPRKTKSPLAQGIIRILVNRLPKTFDLHIVSPQHITRPGFVRGHPYAFAVRIDSHGLVNFQIQTDVFPFPVAELIPMEQVLAFIIGGAKASSFVETTTDETEGRSGGQAVCLVYFAVKIRAGVSPLPRGPRLPWF